jgi:hypothetical protein
MAELSPDDLATLVAAAALLAKLSPEDRVDVEAAAQEAERQREKAAYDAEIADREQRQAASPEFQESRRAWQRERDNEHQQRLAKLKAMAKLTSPPDHRAPEPTHPGWTLVGGPGDARYRCAECRQNMWSSVKVLGLGKYLCEPCDARHQLRCDQCGRRDEIISTHCTDGAWRCDDCLSHIAPIPAKQPSAVASHR